MVRVGVDIGGTKVNIGLLDDRKKLLGSKKMLVQDIVDLAEAIKITVDELCAEHQIDSGDIVSCGIGVPGTVSENGRRLLKAPNLSILSDDLAAKAEKLLDCPVTLIQDSRAAAWGEYLCGAGKGKKSVVCITLGTGIGTGIVMDGRIFDGALGCAGEMGHIPVRENGRACGCGKRGCLEKYAAGLGLEITARELLGEGASAADLFDTAAQGNAAARQAVGEAVEMLGDAVVSIINLLSPACILFSGGLSAREKDYIDPIIAYVKAHCYALERLPDLRRAGLGENAPLIGAALAPVKGRRKPELSASIMCADMLHLGEALYDIEKAGIRYIHCDIMDNHFVPNLMLPVEMLNTLHGACGLPFDYHIMAENPAGIIENLAVKPGDIIAVHVESTAHLEKAVSTVLAKGARAAAAINPATGVETLRELLPQLSVVLVMTVNPGFAGQKMFPGALDKIRRVREYLDQNGYEHIAIEVDGNCSFENVPRMRKSGADMFVVGTSSVFHKDYTVREGAGKLMALMAE